VFQSLADAGLQWRFRHRTEIALERTIVEIESDRDLPFSEGDQARRIRLDFAERLMKRGQIDDLATEVVRFGSLIRRDETAKKSLGHIISVLKILGATVGDVVRLAQANDLIAWVGSLVMPKSRPTP